MGIIHFNGKSYAVDGSSRSPSLAHSSVYASKNRRLGYKSTTVPSTLSMIGFLHERYGTLEWQKIVAPSIRIAKKGYKITQLQHDLQVRELKTFFNQIKIWGKIFSKRWFSSI